MFTKKLVAYARLGKIAVYQHAYLLLLVALLLHRESVDVPRVPLALVLILVTMFAIKFASCAADDIMGYRDGSDAKNYLSGGHLPVQNKPLLTGALDESEATRFATGSAIVAVFAALGAVFAVGGHVPWQVVVGYLVTFAVVVQYSWGVRFSYRPGGAEFVMFIANAAEVVLPYWLIAQYVGTDALLVAALAGTQMLLVTCYANFGDRQGDAESGKRTLAVAIPPREYKGLLIVLGVAGIVLAIMPFVFGTLRPVMVICMVPLIAMRVVQMYKGVVQGDSLSATRIGFRAIDVGSIGLALAILLS